jgi:hypothetical protein
MNWLVFSAGLVCAFATLGHFAIGSKKFLMPMLEAEFEPVPRKVMHCVFHYVSAFMILSTAALLCIGSGAVAGDGAFILARFIAVNYAAFAVWQIVLASSSQIENGVFKLFQWMFFAVIAALAWIGA